MDELIWFLSDMPSYQNILFGTSLLIGIALFNVLAAHAEARMWHAICRFNGERRALQRYITLRKSHPR
jgi:hypothetical protein